MGLGGITRDSIVGLNKLIHDDDSDERQLIRRRSDQVVRGWGDGSDRGGNDEFLFLEMEQEGHLETSVSQASFEQSLNDGLELQAPRTSSKASPAASSTPTPKTSAVASSHTNKSSTGTRALESYCSTGSSPTNRSVQSHHYQGFQYEGFTDYYSDPYGYDELSHSDGGTGLGRKSNNVFCCFFAPWKQPMAIEADDSLSASLGKEAGEPGRNLTDEGRAAPAAPPSDALSSVSSVADRTEKEPPGLPNLLPYANTPKTSPKAVPAVTFEPPQNGEKPTTPHLISGEIEDSASNGTSASPEANFLDEKKQEDCDLGKSINVDTCTADKDESGSPPIKGILKVKHCSLTLCALSSAARETEVKKREKEAAASSSPSGKRHLFPSYEPRKSQGNVVDVKKINFNPMARVLSIPSRKDIPIHHKAQVWWQKCDYDEFKKTGRIISKAMECGGSEIWLASSNAWGDRAAKQARSSNVEEEESDEYNKALSKYIINDKGHAENSVSNKWWCKFGHSRRGLEHVASSSEGKARQSSVLLATRMVMEEQKRQRASRMKDPNKLRNVALQYTSWARDLALAAGTADAEAVMSGFDPTAKCRAHHFAQRLSITPSSVHNLNQSNAGGGVAMAVTSQILDAHTHHEKDLTGPSKRQSNGQSDGTLSNRAKGFLPGGIGNTGLR